MKSSVTTQVLELARDLKILRPRDLTARNIPHTLLSQLHEQGRLERVARGLYRLPGLETTGSATLAEACSRVPDGVICLLSALRFHDLGTQSPFDVWMAIHPKARAPRTN